VYKKVQLLLTNPRDASRSVALFVEVQRSSIIGSVHTVLSS